MTVVARRGAVGIWKRRLRIAPRRKQFVMKVGGAIRPIILLQVGHRIMDVFSLTAEVEQFSTFDTSDRYSVLAGSLAQSPPAKSFDRIF